MLGGEGPGMGSGYQQPGSSRPHKNGRANPWSLDYLKEDWRKPVAETPLTTTGESSTQNSTQSISQSTSQLSVGDDGIYTLHDGGVRLPSQDDAQRTPRFTPQETQETLTTSSRDKGKGKAIASPQLPSQGQGSSQGTQQTASQATGESSSKNCIYKAPQGDWRDRRSKVHQADTQNTPAVPQVDQAVGHASSSKGIYKAPQGDWQDPRLKAAQVGTQSAPTVPQIATQSTPTVSQATTQSTPAAPLVGPQSAPKSDIYNTSWIVAREQNQQQNQQQSQQQNQETFEVSTTNNISEESVRPLPPWELKKEPRDFLPELPFGKCYKNLLVPARKNYLAGPQGRVILDEPSNAGMESEKGSINDAIYHATRLDQMNQILANNYSLLVINELGLTALDFDEAQQLAEKMAHEMTAKRYTPGGAVKPQYQNLAVLNPELHWIIQVYRLQMDISVFSTVNQCFIARTRLAAEAMWSADEAGLDHRLPIFDEMNSVNAEVRREANSIARNLSHRTGGLTLYGAYTHFLDLRGQLRHLRAIVPKNSIEFLESSDLIDHELAAMDETTINYVRFIRWVKGIRTWMGNFRQQLAMQNANYGHPSQSVAHYN